MICLCFVSVSEIIRKLYMNVNLPGRLSHPDMEIKDDLRADPRMVTALEMIEMDGAPAQIPVGPDSPLDEILAFCIEIEAGSNERRAALTGRTPPVENVTSYTEVIKGVDGNAINLYIHKPTDIQGPIPAVIHTHGGGMVVTQASDVGYQRWRDELASTGLLVIGVEFRNGAGVLGPHPFPAGLNDCTSATKWAIDNMGSLGISKIIISGESGGGNLSIAVALKAKAEGWVDDISGVYSQCPYISNLYHAPPAELPSLVENDDYFLNVGQQMATLAIPYDPDRSNVTNPLAWPYHAAVSDLEGLPPFVISVNELDPLRDEGLVFYRKLVQAGVTAYSRTVNGTCHAGDCLFLDAMPDVYRATLRDIKGFADSL